MSRPGRDLVSKLDYFFVQGACLKSQNIPKSSELAKGMAWTLQNNQKSWPGPPQSLEKGVLLETILGAFGSTHCKQHAFKNSVENRGAALQTSQHLDK